MTKIIEWNNLKSYRKYWQNKKSVLVGGCFDLFHYGHLRFLQQAKKQGKVLIAILESDEFIKKSKKRQPVHNQRQRAEILSSLTIVDFVILIPYFSTNENYFNLVKNINPSIIAVTDGDRQLINKKRQAEMIGSRVVVVSSLLPGFSSRKIIKTFNIYPSYSGLKPFRAKKRIRWVDTEKTNYKPKFF